MGKHKLREGVFPFSPLKGKVMKTIFAALTLAALSTQAMAYDYNQSKADEWEQRHGTAETQRIEEAARKRQIEHNDRMRQLEHQQRIQQQESEWRQRQLEAEQYRLLPP